MSRDPRRLFKQPRNPRRWTPGAYGFVATLVVVIVVPLAWVTTIALGKAPHGQPADPWAATGTVFGGGAFVLAALATIIATVAYINSTEKPSLRLEASYPGQDQPLHVDWHNGPPDESSLVISTGQHASWSLVLRLYNDGPVAARFVAIHVTFGQGLQIFSAGAGAWLKPWRARSALSTETDEVWWEGGADAVVHPRWPYDVPQLGPTALRLSGPQSQTSFQFEVEVVADDVPAFSNTCTIKVPLGK